MGGVDGYSLRIVTPGTDITHGRAYNQLVALLSSLTDGRRSVTDRHSHHDPATPHLADKITPRRQQPRRADRR